MTTKRRFMFAAATAVAVDVATKIAAVTALGPRTVDVKVLDLHVARNDGVAFGAGSSFPPALLVLITLVATVALAVAIWRGSLPAGIPTGLVVGGAVANVADRMIGGTVIDMFDLGWWPAFNVADMCIVLGVGWLLVKSFHSPSTLGERETVMD